MKVDVEMLYKLKAEINKINSVDIEDIEFYENGKKIKIPQEYIKKWKFIGLNNVAFITTDFYLGSDLIKS